MKIVLLDDMSNLGEAGTGCFRRRTTMPATIQSRAACVSCFPRDAVSRIQPDQARR